MKKIRAEFFSKQFLTSRSSKHTRTVYRYRRFFQEITMRSIFAMFKVFRQQCSSNQNEGSIQVAVSEKINRSPPAIRSCKAFLLLHTQKVTMIFLKKSVNHPKWTDLAVYDITSSPKPVLLRPLDFLNGC